jgi:enamine deaminase RidA (YjgF/YER057c/UK114 family)
VIIIGWLQWEERGAAPFGRLTGEPSVRSGRSMDLLDADLTGTYHEHHWSQTMPLEHINPDSMHKNPAFSQGIIIPANARILIIGGQNAVDAKGEIVGKGDIAAQTKQAVANLFTVLEAAGGKPDNLVRIGLILREDADLRAGFGAWMEAAGSRLTAPPTVTSSIVAKLATPDYLIEIEAMAVLE